MLRRIQILLFPLVYMALMANSCGMRRGIGLEEDQAAHILVSKSTQQEHYPGIHSNLRSVINVDIEFELLQDTELELIAVLMDSVKVQPESIKILDKFYPYEKFPSAKGKYILHCSRNTYQEAPKNMHEEVFYEKSGRKLSKKYILLFKSSRGEFEIETVPVILESLRHP